MSTPAIGVLLTPQPQPPASAYPLPLSARQLAFPRTRQAGDPQFNPAYPTKKFSGGVGQTFQQVDPATGQFSPFTIPADQPDVNFLPETYQAYVVQPTVATGIPGAPGAYADPAPYLSDLTAAVALMQSLGGSGLADAGQGTVNYGTEIRRVYTFVVNGATVCAGTLIAQMSAAGIGAPGSWAKGAAGQPPTWVPAAVPAIPANVQDTPIPYQALYPGESVQVKTPGFFPEFEIVNASAPALAAGLSATQAAQLSTIAQTTQQNNIMLEAICKTLSITIP